MNGEIVWLNPARGYGFVRPSDGGPDIAFDLASADEAVRATLVPGDSVNFTVRHDALGPLAHRLAAGHIDDEAM
ncbi:MAG: cold shock domain-containing protein [Rhodospirillales bacterium]|nr:cold shock domain-containing protein [Rhodospirillales bacterium]